MSKFDTDIFGQPITLVSIVNDSLMTPVVDEVGGVNGSLKFAGVDEMTLSMNATAAANNCKYFN